MGKTVCWKSTILIVSLIASFSDLVIDWVFYGEQLLKVKDGLVFGPYDHDLVMATLVFCVIASVTFLAEILFDIVTYYKDNDRWDLVVEMITAVTLLIEDLPQIVINLHIARCREEATNDIQIWKASTAMFEVLVKLCFIGIQFYRNKGKQKKKASKLRKALKLSTCTLLVIILALSISVICLSVNFRKSDMKLYSEGLDGEAAHRYLNGVGVFMRLQTTHPRVPNMEDNQWMMLTGVTKITSLSAPGQGMFLSVIFTTAPLQYIWVRKHFPGPPESMSCYQRNSTSENSTILLPLNKCSDILSRSTNTTTVSMRFTYIPTSSFQPMGDIHYNTELRLQFDHILTDESVTLKYFKVKPKVQSDLALTTGDHRGQYRFYNAETDLRSVREVWKTGITNCDNTGRESPKLDTDLFVRCVF